MKVKGDGHLEEVHSLQHLLMVSPLFCISYKDTDRGGSDTLGRCTYLLGCRAAMKVIGDGHLHRTLLPLVSAPCSPSELLD